MLWLLRGCDGKGVTEPEDMGDTRCVVEERSLERAIRFDGEADGDWAGGAVAGAGDVDGDGGADVLVGAADNGEAGTDAGAVYLVTTGANAVGLRNTTQFAGTSALDMAGWSVAGVGDLDGDGRDDFAFGAPGNDAGGGMAGTAALVLGGSVTAWLHGTKGEGAGASVAGPGDVNGAATTTWSSAPTRRAPSTCSSVDGSGGRARSPTSSVTPEPRATTLDTPPPVPVISTETGLSTSSWGRPDTTLAAILPALPTSSTGRASRRRTTSPTDPSSRGRPQGPGLAGRFPAPATSAAMGSTMSSSARPTGRAQLPAPRWPGARFAWPRGRGRDLRRR